MIAPSAETAHANPDEVRFARYSADLWPDFASEIEQASRRAIGYRRDGALLVAMTTSEMDAMGTRNAVQALDVDEARRREPMLASEIAGALWDPEEGQVDNRRLAGALTVLCRASGANISVVEAVVRIDRFADGFGVHTPFAMHHADKVVIAAGAWSSQIVTPAVPPIRPVKGEIIVLAPPDGALLPREVVWGNGVYLVPRAGRLLIGATMEEAGFDTSVSGAARDWLHMRAASLMPALARWPVDDQWSGLRPATTDGLPILGETVEKDLFIAGGQFRNGILFAPAIADTMSALVLGEQVPQIAAFTPKRFAAG